MKKKLFFILWLGVSGFSLKAQTTRPGVLVVGNGNAAAAAAIQSAVSGVKTTIILQAGGFDINPIGNDIHIGVQLDFLKKINLHKGIKDSLSIPNFDKQTANEVLVKWTDSLKNLTVIKNVMWVRADRAGSNWSFKLADGQNIRPKVLINAGDTKLKDALEIKTTPAQEFGDLDYNTTIYRTSISSGLNLNGKTANILSLYNLFIPEQENLVWVKENESMLAGQAAGAAAAYSAFFDIKTSATNLKAIQGELVNYRLALMPFIDINQHDANWKAIQFVGVTGVMKAEINNGEAKFMPEKTVNTEEIKQPIKDLYYKAQIWFDDYKNPLLTIGAAIEMVCYVGNKSTENTPKEIEKKWKTSYKFTSDFDTKRQINRRELAVILQDYLPPFNVNIDKTGKIVR